VAARGVEVVPGGTERFGDAERAIRHQQRQVRVRDARRALDDRLRGYGGGGLGEHRRGRRGERERDEGREGVQTHDVIYWKAGP